MWTDEDIDYALAWQTEQDEKCPGCGHPLSESLDPAKTNDYVGEAVVCFGCEAQENKAREFRDYAEKTGEPVAGLHVGATDNSEV